MHNAYYHFCFVQCFVFKRKQMKNIFMNESKSLLLCISLNLCFNWDFVSLLKMKTDWKWKLQSNIHDTSIKCLQVTVNKIKKNFSSSNNEIAMLYGNVNRIRIYNSLINLEFLLLYGSCTANTACQPIDS